MIRFRFSYEPAKINMPEETGVLIEKWNCKEHKGAKYIFLKSRRDRKFDFEVQACISRRRGCGHSVGKETQDSQRAA